MLIIIIVYILHYIISWYEKFSFLYDILNNYYNSRTEELYVQTSFIDYLADLKSIPLK